MIRNAKNATNYDVTFRQADNYGKLKAALKYIGKKKYLYILLLPCIVFFFIFHYIPMYGVTIAFKDFSFSRGILKSPWVGFDNFSYMFGLKDFYKVFLNSLTLSFLRIIFGFPAPIILALLLNEMRGQIYKRFVQTVLYLPHFVSWVVIGGIIVNFLSPTWGIVNQILQGMGYEPIFFMAKSEYFRPIIIISEIWKESGWGTIIYLAALAGINPELYEAAIVDGANRFQRLLYITMPCIKSTIITLLILRVGAIMGNGFEQIFVFQNISNLDVSEVFETYTYRVGMLGGRFAFSTTVGLFTSVIGMIMIFFSNKLAKITGENGIY